MIEKRLQDLADRIKQVENDILTGKIPVTQEFEFKLEELDEITARLESLIKKD